MDTLTQERDLFFDAFLAGRDSLPPMLDPTSLEPLVLVLCEYDRSLEAVVVEEASDMTDSVRRRVVVG